MPKVLDTAPEIIASQLMVALIVQRGEAGLVYCSQSK